VTENSFLMVRNVPSALPCRGVEVALVSYDICQSCLLATRYTSEQESRLEYHKMMQPTKQIVHESPPESAKESLKEGLTRDKRRIALKDMARCSGRSQGRRGWRRGRRAVMQMFVSRASWSALAGSCSLGCKCHRMMGDPRMARPEDSCPANGLLRARLADGIA